jgi:hypothetical protein
MRKKMTKEVTSTIVKVAKIEMVEGVPTAVALEDVILLGNVDAEKAQKLVSKKLGNGVSVVGTEVDTKVYEAPVEEFLKIATVKVAEETDQKEEA